MAVASVVSASDAEWIMRRAERLFEIIQILRRSPQPLTAVALATELETSRRSVYRDIAALAGQGVPIRGEAGIGYVLEKGFDLPPLMLTSDEVEAAVLGAQWVAGHGDPALARAARDLIAKISAVVPAHHEPFISNAAVRTRPAWEIQPDGIDVAKLRLWARRGHKVELHYRDAQNIESRRIIWPIIIGYFEARRIVVAWCELRHEFREFRLDRVMGADFLPERIPDRPTVLRKRWLDSLKDRQREFA